MSAGMRGAAAAAHVSRVRVLYKTILRLHRGLPPELRAFGDEYAQAEFRRHRGADAQFIPVFMHEWTQYAVTLAGQLGRKASYKQLGVALPEQRLSEMSEEQVAQLFELFREAQGGPSREEGHTGGAEGGGSIGNAGSVEDKGTVRTEQPAVKR